MSETDRIQVLKQCIARVERLLQEGGDSETARVYEAEFAAARAQLKETERRCGWRPA